MDNISTLTDILKRTVTDDEFLKILAEHPQKAFKEYPSLTTEERASLVKLFEKFTGVGFATHKLEEVFESSRRAFIDMRIMNWIAFLVGIVLVSVSIWLGISGQREVYVAIFGSMGIVSLITYLLVRPMKGVRDALSDFLQAHITFETVNQQIGIWHPEHFKPKDIQDVREASNALQAIRESSVRLLQEVLEEKSAK